jgi:hypothetical protein
MNLLWFSVCVLGLLCVALFGFVCWGLSYYVRYVQVQQAFKRAWFAPDPQSQSTTCVSRVPYQASMPAWTEQHWHDATLTFPHTLAVHCGDLLERLQEQVQWYKEGHSTGATVPVESLASWETVQEWSSPLHLHHPPMALIGRTRTTGSAAPVYFVVFRGTGTPVEMEHDFRMSQVPYPEAGHNGAQVHQGCWEWYQHICGTRWQTFYETVTPATLWCFTGYSLGASLALFAGLEMAHRYPERRVVILLFAMPRVGDPLFVQWADSLPNVTIWGLCNRQDLICDVPPTVTPNFLQRKGPLTYLYQHVGRMWEFDWLQPSLMANHQLNLYRQALTEKKRRE